MKLLSLSAQYTTGPLRIVSVFFNQTLLRNELSCQNFRALSWQWISAKIKRFGTFGNWDRPPFLMKSHLVDEIYLSLYLILVEMCRKVEWFYLIWATFERFVKKNARLVLTVKKKCRQIPINLHINSSPTMSGIRHKCAKSREISMFIWINLPWLNIRARAKITKVAKKYQRKEG